MAVLSTSQCYQAARHHLRPPYDSIWVPGSLLASAFERYAATFRTGARHGSSAPGPMEHKKRMARRHMGELHFGQSHSSAPIWDLANLVDLTQWKWSPPTSSASRNRQDMNTAGMRALSDAALQPLRIFSPPRTDITDGHRKIDELLLPTNVILHGVVEPLASVSWSANTSPLDVIDLALESLSRDISDGIEATPLFSRFCDNWQKALAAGLFHGEAISTVLTGITDFNMESIGVRNLREFEPLKLLLLEATIEGISKGWTDQVTPFDYVNWNTILRVLSTLQMNTVRTFTKAMACIPEVHIKSVSSGILENLDAFFNGLGRACNYQTLARQANKMVAPLKSLGKPEFRFILDDATQKLSEYTRVGGVAFSQMRFGWLQLLARLPGVEKEFLAQTCVALETSLVHRPLSETEISHLFLAWSNREAPLKRYTHLRQVVLDFNGKECYYLLSARLWRTRQFYRVRHFSDFLHAIGRENATTLLARAVCNPRRNGPSPLANIALRMRKPRAALDILCLYDESRRCKKSFWQSTFGFKALEILTWVPAFDYKRLWGLLQITLSRREKIRRLQGPTIPLGSGEIRKIVAAAIVTGRSPHLTTQKAFALMMDCYVKLRRHNAFIPRSFLRILVYNVTRHIVNGQPGVITRLRLVLYIIQSNLSEKEAFRTGMAIERRRKFNMKPK